MHSVHASWVPTGCWDAVSKAQRRAFPARGDRRRARGRCCHFRSGRAPRTWHFRMETECRRGEGHKGLVGGRKGRHTPAQPLGVWACLRWGSTGLSYISPFSLVTPSYLPSNRPNYPPLTQATLRTLPGCILTACSWPIPASLLSAGCLSSPAPPVPLHFDLGLHPRRALWEATTQLPKAPSQPLRPPFHASHLP